MLLLSYEDIQNWQYSKILNFKKRFYFSDWKFPGFAKFGNHNKVKK